MSMTKAERQQLKELFSKYCRSEVNAGHCIGDTCEFCPIDKAYKEIFKADDKDHEEGVCPVCGAKLEYVGPHEILDDSVVVEWTCPECESSSKECYDIVFDCHEHLCKKDDSSYTAVELADKDLNCGEVCPICGGELEFHGDQDLTADYEGTEVSWTCTKCGTMGTEISNLVFSEHIVDGVVATEKPAENDGDEDAEGEDDYNVCPCCGGHIEPGEDGDDDDGHGELRLYWHCEDCGAEGYAREARETTFVGHEVTEEGNVPSNEKEDG